MPDTIHPPPSPSRRRCLLSGLGSLGTFTAPALVTAWPVMQAAAQTAGTAPSTVVLKPSDAAAVWRGHARLNYGIAPSSIEKFATHFEANAWALGQIDAARAASAQAPFIPPSLPMLALGIPDLIRGMREARQMQREQQLAAASASSLSTPAAPSASSAAMPASILGRTSASAPANPPPVQPAGGEPSFIQQVVRQGAAWRLAAASNPALEQPLLARMTEFWFNHFNVNVGKGSLRTLVNHYVLHAIRPHALGRFEDLLLATARHPAMLLYLDQAQSVAEGTTPGRRGLNENYARELLELHTLGADGGYTQADVRELARLLTGWTVDAESASGFRFVPRWHDSGRKTVLGQTFNPAGVAEGEAAIRLLAHHPRTARRIARRLAQWLVADDPPALLVDTLADTFSRSQGDIAAVLRTLVQSAEFWDPRHSLLKTPMDFACSALTALGGVGGTGRAASADDALNRDLIERDVQQVLGFLYSAGQAMHAWPTPDGYPVDKATWLNPEALTRRADLAMALAARRDVTDLPHLRPFFSAETLARIDAQPPRLRVGLMLASPDFMRK